jgi:7,8-dihydroneopterin aldolase/epimerase/oxygenase
MMIVEVHGLEVFGRHGVNEDERDAGQTFFVDVTLERPEPTDDSIEATSDYRVVRDVVHRVSEDNAYRWLESFAAAAADALSAALPGVRVRLRVRKPGIAWAEWAAVTVERP